MRDTVATVVWLRFWWMQRSALWTTSSTKWNDELFAGGELEGSICAMPVLYEDI